MKELKGTEKQIKWADDIRTSAINHCDINIKFAKENLEKNPNVEIYKDNIEFYTMAKNQLVEMFDKIEDAGEIINRREFFTADRINWVVEQLSFKKNQHK